MIPNLSYISYHLFGIEPDIGVLSVVKTYGFFLAVCMFVATVLFKIEMRRKEREGVFGHYDAKGDLGYSGMFTNNFFHAHTLLALTAGVIGAKIASMLEILPRVLESPKAAFFESGIAAYGGLILGTFASYLYFKKNKIPFIIVLDTVSPILALSYSIARIGCQLSGDGCWGIAATEKPKWWFLPDWTWAWHFPHNVLQQGNLIEDCTLKYNHVLDTPVIPTSLYEMALLFAIFLILWRFRKSEFKTGFLFGMYLVLTSVERFFIEIIRVNVKFNIGGYMLSQAQIIALCLGGIGLILCALRYSRNNQNPKNTEGVYQLS